jgi:hypothetical protein
MSISLSCPCGRTGRLNASLAGRKVRCPNCKKLLEIPTADGPRDVEQEALDLWLSDSPAEERAAPAAQREEAVQTHPAREPARAPMLAPPRMPHRPKASSKVPERAPRVVFEEGWFGSVNAGVIGGVLMILIAVVWFVVGFAAGRIFFYPPILVLIGFGAIIKGLFNRD